MLLLRLSLLLLAFAPLAEAGPTRSTTLHIVSYNIKGLPSLVLSGEYKESRYPLIGKLLSGAARKTAPALVLLQEAFDSKAEALFDAAKFPYKAAGPGASSFLGVGSGLYVLSQYPILEQDTLAFGPEHCLSWDCFANKGVQFVRVSVPGLPRPLEVFNTHLQAGREDTQARRSQVKLLLEFFKRKHQEGNPVIFAGDFNFRPGLKQQSYLDFASGLTLKNAGEHCLERGCFKGEDAGWHGVWSRSVDHHFYSKAGPVEILPVKIERNYRELVDSHKLSDHPTYEVEYELRWLPTAVVGQKP